MSLAIGGMACASHPLVVTEPPSLSVKSAHVRSVAHVKQTYGDFWSAISAADFPGARGLASTDEQRQLTHALEAMRDGDDTTAERLVVPLLHANNAAVQSAARVTYGAILSARSEWEQLAAFADSDSTQHIHEAPPGVIAADEAGVEAWAQAFRQIRTTAQFVAPQTVLPFDRTQTGAPIVAVRVNGVVKHFWIDTGSSITILAAPTAVACQVVPIQSDTLELSTSVGRIPARPGVIHQLEIGGLEVSEAPAMIVEANLLTLRTNSGEVLAVPSTVHVDGIIGFDLIRKMDLTIDDTQAQVVVRQPVLRKEAPRQPRNLFWFGVPIVELTSEIGLVVHLSLDTGAEETYGTPSFVAKTNARSLTAERRIVQGFGGSSPERGVVVPRVQLFLGRTLVTLEKMFLYNAQYPTIYDLDGTLGADIGRGNVMRIDMTNGLFEIQ